METLTIKLPEVLVRDAKEAAEKLGMSLNRFMMQAIFIRVQELPTKREPIVFDKERFHRDNKWIDENYQEICEQYPNQWFYVYDQKVCGADRDMARAERLARAARAEIGDVHRLGAVALFIGGDHAFF
jgi:hypothetical protein